MAQQQQQLQHHYEGGGFLRQRLLLATLTGTPVRISRMHLSPPSANAAAPRDPLTSDFSPLQQQQIPHVRGVQPYEASLLRLLCSITEGSRVHINAAGTTLTYYPGQLIGCDPDKCLGGAPLVHHCHSSKPISYYVEPLLLLAPFCKYPLHIKFTGVTDLDTCISRGSRSSNSNSSNSSRNSSSNSSRSSIRGDRRCDDSRDTGDGGRSYDSDDERVRSSSASRNSGRKCSEKSRDISSGNGGRWSFVCADPPIDFVRSVTIPTLQRLLRLATTPARVVGSSSRAEGSSSTDSSSNSNSSSTSKPGKEETEVRRTQELPEPFYLLRVLRRCCGSQKKKRRTAAGGAAASDFGEVLLKTRGILREPLQPFVWVDVGRVKRIRGTAFAAGGITPLFAKRCISRARYIFNMLLPDVWIYLEKQQPKQHTAGATRSSTSQGRVSAAAAETSSEWAAAQKGEEEEKKQQQQQGSGECVGLTLVAETIKGNYKGAAGLWCLADAEEAAQANSGRVSGSAAADAWRASGSCKMELLLQQSEASGPTSAAATAGSSPGGATAADLRRGGEAEQEERATDEEEEKKEEGQAESGAERLADVVARRLLLEVQQGGVVDTAHQCLPLLFAALAEEHAVSRIRLSRLTPYAVQFVRHLRDFLGVVFHVETDATPSLDFEDSEHRQLLEDAHNNISRSAGVTLKCVGVGLKNMARATF